MSSCPPRPEDSMGSDEDWEAGDRTACKAALDELGLPYAINEGDGAFYGPKIDFHLDGLARPHLAVRHDPAGFPAPAAL